MVVLDVMQPWTLPLPGHSGRKLHSSFMEEETLPGLVQELNEHAKHLRGIDDRITTTQAVVPKALGKLKCQIPGREKDVEGGLDQLTKDASVIQELVTNITERLHESLNEAMSFNDLMHRQFEYKGNRLPDEISEFSGTVVSNLHRAENMAKKEMVTGAKDLIRLTDQVKTMIRASSAGLCPASLSMAMLLQPGRDVAEARRKGDAFL
ncbi:unnamed protein product [Cladocopium goreaui]|uniref:Uncharacterized protein n=1 Tax=Cladocopium goreaui TaxID=2562237 RepID=A0A9P1FZF4_9DINO|nr:unnamed protein product [Cladocopium goreaui]